MIVSRSVPAKRPASSQGLSYSRPSGFPTVPEPVTARSRASPRCELPTLARLNEPDGTLTRVARCKSRYGPKPLDGICTHFDERDLAERKNASLDKACLRRPVNYATETNVKITPKKLSIIGITFTSLRRAWRTTLAVPCSTGHIATSGKLAPLAGLGKTGFTGRCVPSE